MTGVTLDLAPWQIDELREFADGEPHNPGRNPANLIRRGMLMNVQHGDGLYAITDLGRAALDRASKAYVEEPTPPSVAVLEARAEAATYRRVAVVALRIAETVLNERAARLLLEQKR